MRLKELRKQNKMTQQVVASKLGVSRSTVAMWETGQNEPDNQMLLQLSMLLNCSVDYLLGRSDDRIDEQTLDIVNETSNKYLEENGNILDARRAYEKDAQIRDDNEVRLLVAYRAADDRAQNDALEMLLAHPRAKEEENLA